jgi:hypothetical protein
MTTSGQTEVGARGRPRELYEFARGHRIWRYTSNSETVDCLTGVYEPANVKRPSIELTPDLNRNNVVVTMDKDGEVPGLFKAGTPSDIVTITISRVMETFTDAGVSSYPTAPQVIWAGRILAVRWSGAVAEMTCEPSSTSMNRLGLRRLWQKPCPHVLYDQASCKLHQDSYVSNGTVTAINGNVGTVAGAGTGNAGGYLIWTSPDGQPERRMVRAEVGANLTLSYPIVGLTANQLVKVYKGCKHNTDDCSLKGNILNYGGQPDIPEKHPFGTNPIF